MKKFILLIAVIILSFGSVWAEDFTIISNGSNTSDEIPFKLNSTALQIVEMIIPYSAIAHPEPIPQPDQNIPNTYNGVFKNDYEYFEGITFYTNTNLSSISVTSCSISIKDIGDRASFNDNNPAPDFSNPTVFDNCTVSLISGTNAVTIDFGATTTDYFRYNKYDNNGAIRNGSIYIKITIQLTNSTSGINWIFNASYSNTNRINDVVSNGLPHITLVGSRVVKQRMPQQSPPTEFDNDIYTFHTGTNNRKATLESFVSQTSKGIWRFTKIPVVNDSPTYDDDPTTTINNYGVYTMYEIPTTITTPFEIDGNYQPMNINKIGKEAFKVTIPHNTVIFLPNTIEEIGIDGEPNECFYVDNEQNSVLYTTIFAFRCNENKELPTLKGSSFNTFVRNTRVELYALQGNDIDTIFKAWKTKLGYNLSSKFGKYGWISYPYNVSTNKIYENNKVDMTFSKEQAYEISSYPFHNTQLKVSLTKNYVSEHDGSWSRYEKITGITGGGTIDATSGSYFTATLSGKTTYEITTTITSNLVYGKGSPYFDYTADKSNYTTLTTVKNIGYNLFKGYESINFRVDNTDPIANVPFWKYTDLGNAEKNPDGSRPEKWEVECPIKVEKEITSARYRYFSLPFECTVSDIVVINKTNPNETIPLFTEDVGTYDFNNLDKNYYIIDEYVGQQNGNDGYPEYTQVRSESSKLTANKGYAFAIVEQTQGSTVEAIITFKSKNSGEYLYLNTYSGHSIALTHTGSDWSSGRNKGWNMIGNPFYYYITANSFYGDDGKGGETHNIKYVTTINDDEHQTVNHKWVNDSTITGSGDSHSYQIKPFEAFFVQVADGIDNILVYPQDPNYTYPTKIAPQHIVQQTNSNDDGSNIQEHLSVKVSDSNGISDKTTVINDGTRDEHFALMDDLAKIMNPGIQIYTWYDNTPCAFKELPLRADSTMAIPLGVRATEAGNYTFSLDTSLTLFYGAAMLHDKQNNQYHPLNENGVQISLNQGEENGRFEIVVIPSEIPAELEDVETSETLDAYVHDGHLVVENIAEGSNLSIYDISGKLVYSADASGDFNYNFSARGVYMVVLRGNTTGSIKVVY